MKLASYLEAHRLSITDFGRSIGRPASTVHGWLSGRRIPSINQAAEIARATQGAVQPNDFAPPSAAALAITEDAA